MRLSDRQKLLRASADPARARHCLDALAAAVPVQLKKLPANSWRVLATLLGGSPVLGNLLVAHPDWLPIIDFKRIDGVSKDYILKMVRAGEGTFTDEFQNAGFDLVDRRDDMFDDNYLLRFHIRPAEARQGMSARSGQ